MGAGGVPRAAVLGHPITHSLSPVLHQAAYAELGIHWQYDAVDVDSENLPGFLAGLGPEWVGLSLTMPLKETVIDLLDVVEPAAARVRAVNTVVIADGRRRGYNTDITGLVGLLREAVVAASAASSGPERTAVVVGAGATARSAVAALAQCDVRTVAVAARRPDAAAELVDLARSAGIAGSPVGWPPRAADLAADLVISTVPADVGARLTPPERPGLLVDVLYDPWPTPLASAWQGAGGGVVGGLELLVRQAVEQVSIMTGRRPDLDAMRRAGQRALDQRSGPPGIAQADQQHGRSTP